MDNRVICSFCCSCWATVSDSFVHSWDEEPSWKKEPPVCGFSSRAIAAIYLTITQAKWQLPLVRNSSPLTCLFCTVGKRASRNIQSMKWSMKWFWINASGWFKVSSVARRGGRARIKLRNCSKTTFMTFSAEVKNSSRRDYSLRSAASTSRVSSLFPNTTRKANGVTHSPAGSAVFGRSRSWNNQRGELRSLMNLWMGWRRLHKREKGGFYCRHLAQEKNGVHTVEKAHSSPALLLLLVYVFHTRTLNPPMHDVEPFQWHCRGTLS